MQKKERKRKKKNAISDINGVRTRDGKSKFFEVANPFNCEGKIYIRKI
jgi:hypothetical protein